MFGLKIDLNWGTYKPWRRRYGDAESFAARLSRWGVDFVEIPVGDKTPRDLIFRVGKLYAATGLRLSVHPYLHGELAPEVFDEQVAAVGFRDFLQTCQELADLCTATVPVVFHGGLANLEPHFTPADRATAAAKKLFAWMSEQVESSFPDLRPQCETQIPYAKDNRHEVHVGDTYETCLDLVRDSAVGICWDFGHTFASYLYGYHREWPSEEFLSRVGHIHAHDVALEGTWLRDHRPFGSGIGAWREYASLLTGRGFHGGVLFELDLMRFSGYDEVEKMFRRGRDDVEKILRPAERPSGSQP